MSTASAVYHDRVTMEIVTPFNRQFVDQLKIEIPPSFREWIPERKSWVVRHPYDTTAQRILCMYFPNAHIEIRPASPFESVASGCSCDADHRVLGVCQSAPLEVVRAAYKALAKLNHPDHGGDHVSMQRLNEAVERIEAEARS